MASDMEIYSRLINTGKGWSMLVKVDHCLLISGFEPWIQYKVYMNIHKVGVFQFTVGIFTIEVVAEHMYAFQY